MNPKQLAKIDALLQQCRGVMALQDKSIATEKQYLSLIRRYLVFTCGQPAEDSSEQKFERWLTEMVVQRDVAVSTQNVAFNAVVWFYKDVAKRPLKDVNALRASKPERVRNAHPVEDVVKLLADVRDVGGYPTNFIVRILYGRGMRLCEPLNLRIKDVRLTRKELVIIGGKGRKDRVVALTPDLVTDFQRQMVVAHRTFEMDVRNQVPLQIPNQLAKKYPELKFNWQWAWLFPAHRPCRHPRTGENVRYRMLEDHVQKAVRESRRRLGLFILPHELRHSFATHLLDTGINPKALQEAMGHQHFDTTAGYCHAEAKSVPHPFSRMQPPAPVLESGPRIYQLTQPAIA